jgi:hypothetical protein
MKVFGVNSAEELDDETKNFDAYPEDTSGDLIYGDSKRSWVRGGTIDKLVYILIHPNVDSTNLKPT